MPNKLSSAKVRDRLDQLGLNLIGVYLNVETPAEVRCSVCGYTRTLRPSVLFRSSRKRSSGCPRCAAKQQLLGTHEVRVRLAALGVTLLSQYSGKQAPIRVRCRKCGHEWRVLARSLVNRGHGCRRCVQRSSCLTKREVVVRLRKNGLLLAGSYLNNHTRIRVRCVECDCAWSTLPTNALYAHRTCVCRNCSGRDSSAEIEARRVVEQVTGWRFPRARPAWLKGRRRFPLELDGYNVRHAVAFEYQGRQHYSPIWGQEELHKTQHRDECKRQLCRRNGVLLIRIPYWKTDVASFVAEQLQRRGVA
jgi:hypothetical protein